MGDVIKAYNDEVVILMDNPNDLYWAVTFKAAYAKQILEWRRPVTAVHPVAHVAMNSVYIDMGPLYVNMDSPEELNIGGLVDTKYHFLTGQDVHPEDKVGDFIVRRVVKVMGVNLVYTA